MSLTKVHHDIVACSKCERLRTYCTEVARVKRAAFRNETYWARPVPGFGDPNARVLILGLAPAAHGANRTGRVFTGDGGGGSGDFLMTAMYRHGFASIPTSQSLDDGLREIGGVRELTEVDHGHAGERDDLGHDVTVGTLGRGGDPVFFRAVDSRVRLQVVPFPDLPGPESVGDRIVRSIAALRDGLDLTGFDVVHAQDCISSNACEGAIRTVHHLDTFSTVQLVACHDRAVREPAALVR